MYTEHILNLSRIEDKQHLIEFINRCDKETRTPLYFAIKSKNEELVELLLRKGADSNSP